MDELTKSPQHQLAVSFRTVATVVTAAFILLTASGAAAAAWRSTLYPDNWTPADKDAQGRFLHDFSYAGYHKGEVSIPTSPPGLTYNVTHAPYSADNTGSSDATAAIQAAIDDAGAAGGGIVYLPAGTYNVAPGGNSSALRISDSGVVLRGAGTNQTFICNTDTYMRQKNVILVQPSSGDWHSALGGSEILASADIDYPTRTIPLVNVSGLSVGDTVMVRADCTDDFIADHGMAGNWSAGLKGPTFLRRITSINSASNTINIDIPTRYYLKTRDNARIYKVADHLEEVGIEDLSIGMVQNTTSGWGDSDYSVNGTGAYEVHGSHVIQFKHARNCWVQRFQTYRPSGNSFCHALSNILILYESAHITVRNCVVQKPQYEGAGGNGYGYTLRSGDCLITECVAHDTRHNYDFKSMWTSGNVIHKSTGSSPVYSSDFHMHLSIANMFDSMTVTGGDWLQAVYRPYGTAPNLHGHSSTEAVFWNTYGEGSGNSVESRQWGWGYVVGTSGSRAGVSRGTANNTAPEDFLEGQGTGATLEPQSLYLDQLSRRLNVVLVKAGTDVTVVPNQTQALDGVVYSYLDGPATSLWTKVSGPTAVFADAQSPATTVACTNVGTYVLRLTAWSGSTTNSDEITIVAEAPAPPEVLVAGPIWITATGAELVGTLTSNGGIVTTVYTYWGLSDGGTDAGSWDSVITNGVLGVGGFSSPVRGLFYGLRYHYRCYAVNAEGGSWSGPTHFVTLPPGGGWSPGELTTAAWFDAADAATITTNATGVTQWDDKSESGKHLTQSTAAYQPATGLVTVNGLNAVDFDGDFLFNAAGTVSDIKSVVMLTSNDVEITGASSATAMLSIYETEITSGDALGASTGALADEILTVFDEDTPNVYEDRQGVSTTVLSSIPASPHIYSYVRSTDWFIGLDGSSDLRDLSNGTRHDLLLSNGFGIGGLLRKPGIPEGFFDGAFCELVMLSTTLSESDRQKLEGYLAHKWRQEGSLPGGHPYKSSAPGAGPGLSITNTVATNITADSADLVGTLDATQSVFTVTVYWSTNNNADSTAWLADGDAASMAVGTYTNVTGLSVTGSVSSLTGGTTYYYTMAATNAATNLWASPNVGFTTIAPTDVDNDGIADDWEIANFGSITVTDGSGDQDNDGFVDLYEYIAGTQPTNSSSCLRIDGAAVVNAGSYELTWPGVSGKTYDVLYKTNLSDSVWLTNATDVAGSEPLTVTTHSVAGPRAFFILRVK